MSTSSSIFEDLNQKTELHKSCEAMETSGPLKKKASSARREKTFYANGEIFGKPSKRQYNRSENKICKTVFSDN